jgi:hypothetical protein
MDFFQSFEAIKMLASSAADPTTPPTIPPVTVHQVCVMCFVVGVGVCLNKWHTHTHVHESENKSKNMPCMYA